MNLMYEHLVDHIMKGEMNNHHVPSNPMIRYAFTKNLKKTNYGETIKLIKIV